MDKFREALDHAVFWAVVTVGLTLIAVFTNPVVLVAAVIAGFQWGYRAASEVYENGIMCAECGDRLDEEMPSER